MEDDEMEEGEMEEDEGENGEYYPSFSSFLASASFQD
jgi:hypothetical protein